MRYYERIGLLPQSTRTPAGYRTYDQRTVERLAFIARAKQLGCTLEEVTGLTTGVRGAVMSTKKQDAALVGVTACAAYCAGPIVGFLAAIGLGTALGAVLWGSIAVTTSAVVAVFVDARRHRHTATCAVTPATESSVELSATRSRQ